MSTEKLSVVVIGAMGRMGIMIQNEVVKEPKTEVTGAVEVAGHPAIGQPTRVTGVGVNVTDDLSGVLTKNAVVIDFSAPAATMASLESIKAANAKLVIGATGFSEEEKATIQEASAQFPIVMAPNMSIGINVLLKVAELMGKALGEEYDIEIVEAHHKHKKDAPSGTALGLAEAVAQGRQVSLKDKACYGRNGLTGERPVGQIGIHAIRGGGVVGEHNVSFLGSFEKLGLFHEAHSRAVFAQGAVKAALFLEDKASGLYNMRDVLGLNG